MKVGVTGASGFIGRALCDALLATGHEVLSIDARVGEVPVMEALVHLAGIASSRAHREKLDAVNVGLTVRLARAAAATGSRLVFVSSVKVHGESSQSPVRETSPIIPSDAYAMSKARAEEALRAIPGLRLAVLRPPLVYGPRVKANFLYLMNAIARGVPLPLASVSNRRSFIYLGNLTDALLRCLAAEGTFLISDGEALSTPQICQALGDALGRPLRLFAFPSRLLPTKVRGSLEIDDTLFRRTFGWRAPYSVEDGIEETVRWYRSR
jgi:nucleoside-diphosphate-sugar epimerase